MNVRTDIHRPSAPEFDPEAYDCRGVWDMSPESPNPAAVEHRMRVVNGLIDAGYHSGSGSSRQCGHCGTHIRYAALMVRADVKEFIYVGETCLEGRFEALTAAEFKHLRETARLNREQATKLERIEALIEANPVLAAVNDAETLAMCGQFVNDIADKLRLYGELSPRQIEAFGQAVARDLERVERDAAREAERLAKVDAGVRVPTGKVTVVGTVAWEGFREDSYSGNMVHKMVVEAAEGWKVWVTVPTSLHGTGSMVWDEASRSHKYEGGVKVGDRVSFIATVTAKDSDPTFGFAKRPSKAQVI